MLKHYFFRTFFISLIFFLLSSFVNYIVFSESKHSQHKKPKTASTKKVKLSKEIKSKGKLSEEFLENLDLPEMRGQYFFAQRAFPSGIVPLDWRAKALEQMAKNRNKVQPKTSSQLVAIGPAPINNGQTFAFSGNVSGRVASLAIDSKQSNIIYLAAAQGGVWKTTDSGNNWTPMTDNAPTQAIGAIAIDPTNSNIIYAGTGEGNLSRDSFSGMGILKSTDGGKSWANLASDTFLGLSFSNLIIDPNTPKTLYASIANGISGGNSSVPTTRDPGIYKSTDGGVSWDNILKVGSPEFASAVDIEMDKTNTSVLYSSFFNKGVFKTTDAGQSWIQVEGGLPSEAASRIDIGIAPSNPNIIYASAGQANARDLLNIYKSTNGGLSWSIVSKPPESVFGNICQCFYDNIITVDPTDPNIVYYGGVTLYKSINGGQSWGDVATNMHPDFHAITINSSSSGKQIYVGNDGGVWSSSDEGQSWNNLNTTLNITQFQSVAIHPTDANITLGGTQDNGTNLYQGKLNWAHADDGDGGFTAIDQVDPKTMYHTDFNLKNVLISIVRSKQGGQIGTWEFAGEGLNQSDDVLFYAPFILDPNNQYTLYFGTSRLYRTTNQGQSWLPISDSLTRTSSTTSKKTNYKNNKASQHADNKELSKQFFISAISAIAVAPSNSSVIYTGSSDGAVFVSQNNGNSFQDVTDNLPNRYISDLVIDPIISNTVYASLGGFQSGHVFKSSTGGKNWQDISGNLPDVPANALVINPNNPRNLFVGTDIGLFQTDDGGQNWSLIGGLPTLAIFDIAINSKLGILRVATHGRGVYELKLDNAVDKTPPMVTVITPNGKEVIDAGSKVAIKWVSNDNIGVMKHDIALSTDGGMSFPISIANGLDGTTQEFLWNVPNLATSQAIIRVTAFDAANNSTNDVSDEKFTIQKTNALDFDINFGDVLEIKRGQSVKVTAQIIRNNGFADKLVVMPDPNMLKILKITSNPRTITTQGNSVEFLLKIKKAALLGKQLLTFTAQDSLGQSRSAVLTLVIR